MPIELPEDTWIKIKVNYGLILLLPFKQGIEFLETLASAYQIEENYNKPSVVQRMDKPLEISFLSQQKYAELMLSASLDQPE